jgi:hypothetical protein
MIVEKIICDYPHCGTVADMSSGMVPDGWVKYEGKHYCLPMHFVLDIDVFGGE